MLTGTARDYSSCRHGCPIPSLPALRNRWCATPAARFSQSSSRVPRFSRSWVADLRFPPDAARSPRRWRTSMPGVGFLRRTGSSPRFSEFTAVRLGFSRFAPCPALVGRFPRFSGRPGRRRAPARGSSPAQLSLCTTVDGITSIHPGCKPAPAYRGAVSMGSAMPAPRGECRLRAVMRISRNGARTTPRGRTTRCIWCHKPVLLSAARRHEGVCPLCVSENSELGWRTVYDRERGIGGIPANLRSAYRL